LLLSGYHDTAIGVVAVLSNDFHVYNPATMTWFDLSSHALGTPPTARFQHGFTSAGGKLYVHGGYGINADGNEGDGCSLSFSPSLPLSPPPLWGPC
jgi:N-acetylneuraminic acid mutarotase